MREISETFTSPEKGDRKAVKLSSLPVEIRTFVAGLKANETSEPIQSRMAYFC